MCGIAGVVDFTKLDPAVVPFIKNSIDLLAHRGPDGQGIYVDDFIALGHTRLSIIDPTGGRQPLSNEDGSLWLVCNGEVFNYIELRADLEKKGHVFSTRTDVEVLLHLYEEYKENLLHHINGQFAMAIWDIRRRSLFLARDHAGISPLYYFNNNNRFAFASEVKALFQLPGIEPQIHLPGLIQTITFWSPLPGDTVFNNVYEIKPGYFLHVTEKGLRQQQYWKNEYPLDSSEYIVDAETAAQELAWLLEDAVRIRLRADVPVGAYLSGGLDSSIITALIKTKSNNRLRTFSIGFQDSQFDETRFQQMTARHLHTEHSAWLCSNTAPGETLDKVIWHTEKPVLRTAPAPLFLLSQFVHDAGFKVVLTGEGADEFFSGYNIYKETKIRCFNARQPGSVKRPGLFSRIYPYISANNRNAGFWQSYFMKDVLCTDDLYYSHRLRWGNKDYIAGFLSPDVQMTVKDYDPIEDVDSRYHNDLAPHDPLTRAHFLEATIFLGGYLLSSQGDRIILGHAVEGRYPFLDRRVIEFANRLHPCLKLRALQEKWILKKSFGSLLPQKVVARAKQPYRAPICPGLTAAEKAITGWLSDSSLAEISLFDKKKAALLYQKCIQGKSCVTAREEMAVIFIMTTEMLLRHFIKSKQAQPLKPESDTVIFDNRSGMAAVC